MYRKYALLLNLKHGKTNLKSFSINRSPTFCSSASDLHPGYAPRLVENKADVKNYDYFKPPECKGHYSIILPPPNITGDLHLGHALTGTIQDVIIRWKRMQGFETVWVPGLDHAGIATQVVVEKQLWKDNKQTRYDLGRQKFNEKVLEWKSKKAFIIHSQLKRLGLSLDWNRDVFTMDSVQANAVSKVFVELFEKGLIFRDDSFVNWSCFLKSAISDIEVNHIEVDGSTKFSVPGYENPVTFGRMAYFSYKVCDSNSEIVVATTRPETILGDVAVAVHPSDERFQQFIGKKLIHPFRNDQIPVIADEFVDRNFGTGAVKITPAHDQTDFAVARKHSLKNLRVFDDDGMIGESFEEFKGLQRFEAREKILERLASLNSLKEIKEHKMSVPICGRSGDIIEYFLKQQWFINCTEMAEKAVDDVKSGRLIIEPKHFENKWFEWLENIRNWCISRQLWWGHQIPAYFCKTKSGREKWIAANNLGGAQQKAVKFFGVSLDEIEICQDEDVLDTWFSSALLPFSVFPDQDDFTKYYPLNLMETGHDILFFWVARMAMLSREITGKLPFDKILLHGIICDSQGRKMSKSIGNVIHPESVIKGASLKDLQNFTRENEKLGLISNTEMIRTLKEQKKMFAEGIPECGADALRFTLMSHNIKNHFINFDIQECYTNKLFCNKIWQATRFIKMWHEKITKVQSMENINETQITSIIDHWILSRYSSLVKNVNENLNANNFHFVTHALKNFLYFELCDVYLETIKRGLRNVESKQALGHCYTFIRVLEGSLRALHPFMPYLTVHLHQKLPLVERRTSDYPTEIDAKWEDKNVEKTIENVMEIIKSIRRIKKIYNITKKYKSQVYVIAQSNDIDYRNFKEMIEDLTFNNDANPILFKLEEVDNDELKLVRDVLNNGVTIQLEVAEELRTNLKMDHEKLVKQREKLVKELEKVSLMISGSSYKLNVDEYTQQIHTKKVATLEEKIARINYILSII